MKENRNTDIAILIIGIFTIIYLPISGKFVIGTLVFGTGIIVIFLLIGEVGDYRQ